MEDGSPVIIKRKSAKHAARSRAMDVDLAPSETTSSTAAGTGDESPSVIASKLKNKLKSRNKPKSKLSFGGDEDVRGRIYWIERMLMGFVGRKARAKSSSSRNPI